MFQTLGHSVAFLVYVASHDQNIIPMAQIFASEVLVELCEGSGLLSRAAADLCVLQGPAFGRVNHFLAVVVRLVVCR